MLVGILSDTHGRADMMAAAVRILQNAGAEFFVHCGDVGGPDMLDCLAGLPSAFVWGNTDWDRAQLQRRATELGINCLQAQGEIELGGKRLAVLHGDDAEAVQRVLAEQRVDYLLQGHTHIQADHQVSHVRCINPGALQRAREKTVALLDTESGCLTFLPVEDIAR